MVSTTAMINDGMKAIREYRERPINDVYLHFQNTRMIEPGMYESRWLEKKLMPYCEPRWDDYFKEYDPAISFTSVDSSGTEIVMTLRTKMTVEETKKRLKSTGIEIEVSNTFPIYKV